MQLYGIQQSASASHVSIYTVSKILKTSILGQGPLLLGSCQYFGEMYEGLCPQSLRLKLKQCRVVPKYCRTNSDGWMRIIVILVQLKEGQDGYLEMSVSGNNEDVEKIWRVLICVLSVLIFSRFILIAPFKNLEFFQRGSRRCCVLPYVDSRRRSINER